MTKNLTKNPQMKSNIFFVKKISRMTSEPKSLKYQSLVAFVNALALDERVEFLGYVKEKLDSDVAQQKLLSESKTLEYKFNNLNDFLSYPKLFRTIFDEIFAEKNLKEIEVLVSEEPSIINFEVMFEDTENRNETPKPLGILLKKIRDMKNKKYEKVVAFFVYLILCGVSEIPGTEKLFSELLFEFGVLLNEDKLKWIFYKILEGPSEASVDYRRKILDLHIINGGLEYFVKREVWWIPRHCGVGQMRHICKRLRIPGCTQMDFGEMIRAANSLPLNKRVFYFEKVMKYKDYFGKESKVRLVKVETTGKVGVTGKVRANVETHIAGSDYRGCVRFELDGLNVTGCPRHSKTYGWSVLINKKRYKVEKIVKK